MTDCNESEERREFAKSLRYISQHPPEWATSACAIAEVFDADYPLWADSGELFSMLADLIDVPASKGAIEDDGTSVCGHCGFRFDVSVEVAGCFSEVVLANHCPQCGRLLVWCDEVDE